jgi:hypothetical protein
MKNNTKKQRVPLRYLPKNLTIKDRKKQLNMLVKSRKLYKKGKYYTRKNVSSYKSTKSKHISNVNKIYNVDKVGPTKELSKATGCSTEALSEIIRKGEGAYYSSGSRPNQTAQSWGKARLASAITSGKAAIIDYKILENGCKPNSKALKMARLAKKKYGKSLRRAYKTAV